MSTYKIALAGNPNCGKTTIFNSLTGANQKTGNYPGVTVEKKEGSYNFKQSKYQVIDLPGIYSFSTNSPEEVIARDVILEEKPDLVVNIIDTSNLERNLYLTVQLMEMEIPYLLVFNMWDEVQKRGCNIDLKKISEAFGAEIISFVGHKGIGVDQLKEKIFTNMGFKRRNLLHYSHETESLIAEIENVIKASTKAYENIPDKWFAVKLIEKDSRITTMINNYGNIKEEVDLRIEHFEKKTDEGSDIYIAEQRYGFISGVCQKYVRNNVELRHSVSDKIDAVLTNKVLGLPIFIALMYLVFKLTFVVGDPLMGWIESSFELLSGFIEGFWAEGSESLLKSLILDGVIGGVGGVVVFLPNIILLFLAIAILEGTGYMSRAAFIMDRIMKSIGLHGNSFIPMLIGFGCTVPAIMATRTLENRKDRFTTLLVAPLMSCGARLPIYALIIPAFFPSVMQAKVLAIIYFSGIALAILLAKLLRSTIFKGETETFIMELPPYRIPTLRSILMQMWSRAMIYLKKAGTIILAISIVMWVLVTFPRTDKFAEYYAEQETLLRKQNLTEKVLNEKLEELQMKQQSDELAYSITGRIGKALEPALKPLGFDWKIGAAMIGAFAAKEVFVAQLGIVYSVGEADEESQTLRDKLKENYTPLIALSIMLFALISAPCMATIAVTKRETNSWGWALGQLAGLTLTAYIVSLLVYQIGKLMGF